MRTDFEPVYMMRCTSAKLSYKQVCLFEFFYIVKLYLYDIVISRVILKDPEKDIENLNISDKPLKVDF